MTGRLDRLVARGAISGYTRERSVAYLEGRLPTLTYSMYAFGADSLANRAFFNADMLRIGGRVRDFPQIGHVAAEGGVWRTEQVRIVVEFEQAGDLAKAVRVVQRDYVAGAGRSAICGSWMFPDVRITGLRQNQPLPGTVPATAQSGRAPASEHVVVLEGWSAPPRRGMTIRPVLLLDCWRDFLAAAAA